MLKKYWKIILLALIALVVTIEAGVFFSKNQSFLGVDIFSGKDRSLAEYAEDVMEKCSAADHRPSCYDKEIPKLMDKISMERSFEVTGIIQEKDENYWYCHILGHELSARETAKNPQEWKGVIARCPSGMCSNGCIHGAFQEKFRAESLPDARIEELKPVLSDICEGRPGWNPTGLERGTCYHALGHLSMYVTDANIEKSIKLCEEVVPANYAQICFDGAFMQIFQPLEPEDFALVEGKQPQKAELESFCSQFPSEQKSSCWSEGWPLYFSEIMTSKGLTEFCAHMRPDGQESRCYNALFYVITAQFALDAEKVKTFCSGLPEDRMGQCFANASSRMVETDSRLVDRSVYMCAEADNLGVGSECYEELLVYSTYNFHAGSEDFYKLCNALPGEWKDKCLSRYN